MEDIMDLINEIRRFNYYASMNEARLKTTMAGCPTTAFCI